MKETLTTYTSLDHEGFHLQALGASGAAPLGIIQLDYTDHKKFCIARASQAVKVVSSDTTMNVLQQGKFEASILNLINADQDFKNKRNLYIPRTADGDINTITDTLKQKKFFVKNIMFAFPTGELPESLENTNAVGDALSVFGNPSASEDERLEATSRLGAPLFGANASVQYETNSYAADHALTSGLNAQRLVPQTKAQALAELTANTGTAADDDELKAHTRNYGDEIVATYYTKQSVSESLRPLSEPTGLLMGDLNSFSNWGDAPEKNMTRILVQGQVDYRGVDLSVLPAFNGTYFDYDSAGGHEVARGGGYTSAGVRSTAGAFNPPGYSKYDFVTVLLNYGVTPLMSRGLDGYNTGFSIGANINYNPNGIPYVYSNGNNTKLTSVTDPNRFVNGVDLRARHTHKIVQVDDYMNNSQESMRSVRGFVLEPYVKEAFAEAFKAHFTDVQNVPMTTNEANDYVESCVKAGFLKRIKVLVDFTN